MKAFCSGHVEIVKILIAAGGKDIVNEKEDFVSV
jgi:hypothetical protein